MDSDPNPNAQEQAGGNTDIDEDRRDAIQEEVDLPVRVIWRPRMVTVEPVLFLYLLAGGLMIPNISALLYRKVCIMQFNEDVCDNLNNGSYHTEEDIVQGQASKWMLWNNYALEIPAIILALVYGSLSDHGNRKLIIAVPVFGQVLSGLTYMLTSIYMDSHVGFTLIGHLISGLSGGWVSVFMACFSYLSEATSLKDRTKRVLIAEGISGFSMGISFLVSGEILEHTSFTFVFALVVGICVLCVIYIIVYLKEPPKKYKYPPERTSCALVLQRVKDAFATVFKKRRDNGRARVLVSIMVVFTSMISVSAMHTLGYLFLKRSPLSWTQSTFGQFLAVNQFIPSLCLLLLVPWLKSRFKLRDTTLMIIGLVSNCLSELWFSFCTQSWMVFIVPIIGIFRGVPGTVLRSILSKLVHSHELGKTFAVVGATQSLSVMVGSTLYNTIYPHTLTFWPGFCFTLGTMIAIIPISMTCWLHRDLGRSSLFRPVSEGGLTQHMEVPSEESPNNISKGPSDA